MSQNSLPLNVRFWTQITGGGSRLHVLFVGCSWAFQWQLVGDGGKQEARWNGPFDQIQQGSGYLFKVSEAGACLSRATGLGLLHTDSPFPLLHPQPG